MISPSLPQTTAPAQDRFIIYSDNSAIVESKNGTAYALRFYDLGGSYKVTDCECRGSATRADCRHRRELSVVLDVQALAASGEAVPYLHAAAMKAILAKWPDTQWDRDGAHFFDDGPCPTCDALRLKTVCWGSFGLSGSHVRVPRFCENCGVTL